MKCPHIWREYIEVLPTYKPTNKKWYELWKPKYTYSGQREIGRVKICVICGIRKYLGEVKS